MSYSIFGHEIHTIHNTNDDTKREVSKLREYLQQFNHMNDLSQMYIKKLRLAVDGKEAQINDLRINLPGTDYYMLEEGDPHAADEQWEASSDLMILMNSAEDAADIEFEIDYDVILAGFADGRQYGVFFWDAGLEIPDSILSTTEHKIIEYYDSYEYVNMFVQDKAGRRQMIIPYNSEPGMILKESKSILSDEKRCRDIDKWYCYDFTIEMQLEYNWSDIPEEREAVMTIARRFAQKYQFINEIDDTFEEQFLICESVVMPENRMNEFIDDVQEILDLGWENDAWIGMKAAFTADGSYPFAVMQLVIDDEGKINKKYYRF